MRALLRSGRPPSARGQCAAARLHGGKKALEWDDDTFKDAGKVGVWTKADSVTLFDDFSYGTK